MTVETQCKFSWRNIAIWILLAVFFALIPGLTRVTVGDPSDELKKKKFVTYKELPVEIGALIDAFSDIDLSSLAEQTQNMDYFQHQHMEEVH